MEDDWHSCGSSDDENEYFYDTVSLVNSHDQSVNSLPHQVTETPCETNLDGLVLGCRQPSKSDQASDLEEKACLHVAIQVPELNETYLCEGKQKINNDVSQLRILSNMMEKETHVDSTSSGEQADTCQILFDIVEDQSDVHGRAVKETAISGHPQSDQLRSGKPDGEPGTHITTTISDWQSQMVEGNLSLNSPNSCTGNLFIMSIIVVQKVNPWMDLVFGQNLVIHHNMLKLKLIIQLNKGNMRLQHYQTNLLMTIHQ